MGGSDRYKVYGTSCPGICDWEKPQTLDKIAGIRANIWTLDILNTKQEWRSIPPVIHIDVTNIKRSLTRRDEIADLFVSSDEKKSHKLCNSIDSLQLMTNIPDQVTSLLYLYLKTVGW